MRGDSEEVDALPVLAQESALVPHPLPRALPSDRRPSSAMLPAVHAAAVAAGGFVAGAAIVGLVHRRHRRPPAALSKGRRVGQGLGRGGRAVGRSGEIVQIVGSRSLLVDVHLLAGRD
jgi:hypothetical protein